MDKRITMKKLLREIYDWDKPLINNLKRNIKEFKWERI
jgi:hypothetical protein